MKQHKKLTKKDIRAWAFEIMMLIIACIFMIPFYYMLVNTFKSAQEATFFPMSLPKEWHFENYIRAFKSINMGVSLKNSLLITICSVFLIVIFGSMAAYPIARRKNIFTRVLLIYFLLGFMVPVQTTLLPLVNIVKKLHMQDSIWGLVLLYATWCNFALFMYSSFLTTVPRELEEAALIDGCTPAQVFWRITFPLMKPVTVTIIIFDVVGIWNDFLMPYLFLTSTKSSTMIMAVYKGIGQFTSDWSLMLCVMVIVLLPVIIFYIVMQKHIMAGITSGAVKG